jgi:hypothetical protein
MKYVRFSVSATLAIAALLITSAQQRAVAKENKAPAPSGEIFATGPTDGGRLYINRSPLLGVNVAVTIKIDGKPAGTLMRNRTYDRYITPGHHTLTALPSGTGGDYEGTLDVRAGQTYSYTASYNVNKLLLTPTGR